jgi:hypothetical protein
LLEVLLLADWPNMHAHHFLLLALWLAVTTAPAAADCHPRLHPPIRSLVTVGAVGGIMLCLANVASDIVSASTIVDQVQLKRAILTHLDKSNRVLFSSLFHPICALDASYYNNPIGETPGRLATAVRLAQARRPLPDCDYVADVHSKRPALIDLTFLYYLGYAEQPAFGDLLSDYDQISITANPRSALRCFVYALKSSAPVSGKTSPAVPTHRILSAQPRPDRRTVSSPSSGRIIPSPQRNPR